MRVKAVVDRSIMVHLYDVVPGDVVYVTGEEKDPVVNLVEKDGDNVRFHYLGRTRHGIEHTVWMNPKAGYGAHLFIHDLKNERKEFEQCS